MCPERVKITPMHHILLLLAQPHLVIQSSIITVIILHKIPIAKAIKPIQATKIVKKIILHSFSIKTGKLHCKCRRH